MFVDFDRVFHPTPEQRKCDIDKINRLIQLSIEKQGRCCDTCQNARYVQESPYNDYLTCKHNRRLRLEGRIVSYVCDKYKEKQLIQGGSEATK
jgi:hypothetical protein